MKQLQTGCGNDLLTSEYLFCQEASRLVELRDGDEEQQALIVRAKAGDGEARQALVCGFLPCILRMAWRYARMAKHCEYVDLCQLASVEVLEALDGALAVEKPYAYLNKVARFALWEYVRMHDCLVMKKCGKDAIAPYPAVVSMDVPLETGGEDTWADVLVDSSSVELAKSMLSQSPERVVVLHETVAALHDHQREVLERCFGLHGRPEEKLTDIGRDMAGHIDQDMRRLKVVQRYKYRGIEQLRRRLQPICA